MIKGYKRLLRESWNRGASFSPTQLEHQHEDHTTQMLVIWFSGGSNPPMASNQNITRSMNWNSNFHKPFQKSGKIRSIPITSATCVSIEGTIGPASTVGATGGFRANCIVDRMSTNGFGNPTFRDKGPHGTPWHRMSPTGMRIREWLEPPLS